MIIKFRREYFKCAGLHYKISVIATWTVFDIYVVGDNHTGFQISCKSQRS
jgi:hypothetical protein